MDNTAIITRYLVEEFLPDVSVAELPPDYDLFAGGVVDSLALLKIIDWLGDRFHLNLDDVEITPDDFRTVHAINQFIGAAGAQLAGKGMS
jgi:acyl carrier protein